MPDAPTPAERTTADVIAHLRGEGLLTEKDKAAAAANGDIPLDLPADAAQELKQRLGQESNREAPKEQTVAEIQELMASAMTDASPLKRTYQEAAAELMGLKGDQAEMVKVEKNHIDAYIEAALRGESYRETVQLGYVIVEIKTLTQYEEMLAAAVVERWCRTNLTEGHYWPMTAVDIGERKRMARLVMMVVSLGSTANDTMFPWQPFKAQGPLHEREDLENLDAHICKAFQEMHGPRHAILLNAFRIFEARQLLLLRECAMANFLIPGAA